MSDIFISYARSTAKQARDVATALQRLGYSVWRDEDLPSHRTYADVIEEQLGSAKAVVVIWSAEATRSQWVRSEADRARGEAKLVQLAVDASRLPMPFDQIQCSDLSTWEGDLEHPAWRRIIDSVAALAGPPVSSPVSMRPSDRPAPAASGPELHAVLAADIEGASLLWLNHRAAMQDAAAAYQATMRAEVARQGGEVFRIDGEMLFAAFAQPADAVAAAAAAQQALAAQSWPGMGALKPRMAIHFGPAERRGEAYFGPALTRCAKLLTLCRGGQVLATAPVADVLAQDRETPTRLKSLGAHPLDDPLTSVGIHQVLVEGLPQDFPPLSVAEDHANNLPRRQGKLIGREAEMAQLANLLGEFDLITITGTGGVGKTRIAIELAHAQLDLHEDGVWLVELAPISDPEQVPGAVARALNIDLAVGQDPVASLVDRMRARACLIVLDNCEHVIDAVAGMAEAVLEHAPKVKLLASSQELLGVEGERVFRLRSLGEPDAVSLFTERASAVDANFAVRGRDAGVVAAICQRLDGIPLAIEMAAARAPSLGCEGVLQRLDDRFRILTGGRRTALPRQRTLQATLDWSHGLLSDADAAVFRRVGVFTGGFTLEAASEVAASEALDGFEVVDALSSLVAKSLVAADTEDNRTRYRLLETTRAYALEKLAAADETETVQRRHAEYFIRFTERAGPDYRVLSDDDYTARYTPDIDNIERAMDWALGPTGDAEVGIELTVRSWAVWASLSLWQEYRGWNDLAQSRLSPETPDETRLHLLRCQASACQAIHPPTTIRIADEIYDQIRLQENQDYFVDSLLAKSNALLLTARNDEARKVLAEVRVLTAESLPSRFTVAAEFQSGLLTWAEEGPAAARPLFDAAIANAEAIGAGGWANFAIGLGSSSLAPEDEPDVAIDGLRNLLGRMRPSDMFFGTTAATAAARLVGLLADRAGQGDIQEAENIARTHEKIAGRTLAFMYVVHLSILALRTGRKRDAVRLAGFADAERAASGVSIDQFMWRVWSERAMELLRAEFSESELTALLAEGARLSQDEAFRLTVMPAA